MLSSLGRFSTVSSRVFQGLTVGEVWYIGLFTSTLSLNLFIISLTFGEGELLQRWVHRF